MSGAEFVGRQPQLAVADGCLADLRRGRGGLLLLTGEPGIGKTRLAEEVLVRAREHGARSVWANGWQGEGSPPLWVWVQVLRQLSGSDEALRAADAADRPEVVAAAIFTQSQAVLDAIRLAASEQALVLVLDDLHWADVASVRVLSFVAAAVRDIGCLLLGTARSTELPREELAELARVGRRLALPPLAAVDAARLLHVAAGPEVSATATDAVLRRSLGNPLFVWEFGQLMAQSGRLDVAPAAVPDAVAAVIERRLARLHESTVEVLRVGAVTGAPFDAQLLARVGGLDVETVRGGLAEAMAAGLVTGDDATGAFGHDLVRDVVGEAIDPVRRTELHRRAAEIFAQRAAGDPTLHAIVADHLDRAGPDHLHEAAQEWERAATLARQMLAYRDAARCFARARRGLSDEPGRRAALLADEGECLLLAGELDDARVRFWESAALARNVGDARTMSRAALGLGTGPIAWEVPLANPEQIALLLAALELLPGRETALRAGLLARLSVAAATPGTVELARQRAAQSLELAQQVGDPRLVAQALAAVNDSLGGPAHTMTRRDNADAIVELAVQAGDPVLELLGYRFRVVADLELGDMSTVDRDIAEFARLAEGVRHPLVSWYVPLFRGMRALLAGDFAAADRYTEEVSTAARATGSDNARMLAATQQFAIDVAADRPAKHAAFEQFAQVQPADWAALASALAYARLREGNTDGAREMFMLHAADGFARIGDDSEMLTTLAIFGRVAAELGERPALQHLYERLLPFAPLWIVDGIAAACWGPAHLELGRLALALDLADAASDHLQSAATAAQRAGARMIEAEIAVLARRCSNARATRLAMPASPEPARDASQDNAFRREGQFWTLQYQGHTVRLKDAKGLHDLARLLAEPGREWHVFDLVGVPDHAEGAAVRVESGVGDLLDARARAAYRRRLAELEDELAEADRLADAGRAEKAGAERDFLLAELAGALGLAGRSRTVADPVERARKAVTARIRLAIGRIDAEHPGLARHLANAIRTGTICAYRPESPIVWRL